MKEEEEEVDHLEYKVSDEGIIRVKAKLLCPVKFKIWINIDQSLKTWLECHSLHNCKFQFAYKFNKL